MATACSHLARRRHVAVVAALSVAAFALPAVSAHAAVRPYSLDGETQVMGDLAVYAPDHVFWSLTDRSAPRKVNFPCETGGGAVMRSFASADGRRVWAMAEAPTGNVGGENPGAESLTSSQPEVCQTINESYAAGRQGGVLPVGFLLLSDDAGAHWRLTAAVPEPGDGTLPLATQLDLQLAADGVRIGSPAKGWSTFDAAGQPLSVWQEPGVAYGTETSGDGVRASVQAPRPSGYDLDAQRTLDDGSVVSVWAKASRLLTIQGRDGRALSSVISRPSFRLRVQAGSYGCKAPKTVTVPGLRQVLPGSDAQTMWGMTTDTRPLRDCGGSGPASQLSLKRLLVRSRDGGRTWKAVRAPAELSTLVAADGSAVVAGFAARGCKGLVARRLVGGSWKTLGCRPLNAVVDQ